MTDDLATEEPWTAVPPDVLRDITFSPAQYRLWLDYEAFVREGEE